MFVFLNGKFVHEDKALVSVFDRGFLYGDALFEAMRVTNGKPFRWHDHLRRLQHGMDVLKIALPCTEGGLRAFADELVRRNRMPEAILRLSLSRGVTGRGYSPRHALNPAVVMSLHPAPAADSPRPARWRVITSTLRLPARDPLARFKTANKLPQVLARAEADDAGADDALLLNTEGRVAETTTGNIFWVKHKVVFTPALRAGALPGVTRGLVLELCRSMGLATREVLARPAALHEADGVFLTMTSFGVVEVGTLDGKKLARSPLAGRLHRAYRALLRAA